MRRDTSGFRKPLQTLARENAFVRVLSPPVGTVILAVGSPVDYNPDGFNGKTRLEVSGRFFQNWTAAQVVSALLSFEVCYRAGRSNRSVSRRERLESDLVLPANLIPANLTPQPQHQPDSGKCHENDLITTRVSSRIVCRLVDRARPSFPLENSASSCVTLILLPGQNGLGKVALRSFLIGCLRLMILGRKNEIDPESVLLEFRSQLL